MSVYSLVEALPGPGTLHEVARNAIVEAGKTYICEFREGLMGAVERDPILGSGLFDFSISMISFMTQDVCQLPNPPGIAPPPFTGGQCVGVNYRVEYCITLNGVEQCFPDNTNLSRDLPGPILSVTFYLGGDNRWKSDITYGDPPQVSVFDFGVDPPLWTNPRLLRVFRTDGMPDDCGDPGGGPNPPTGPDPPPKEYPIIIPVPDPNNPGQTFDFTFVVPVAFVDVDANFGPFYFTLDIGGISAWVDMDLNLHLDDEGGGRQMLKGVERRLDDIEEKFEEEFTANLGATTCDPEDPPLVAGLTGSGFGLIASALTALNNANQFRSNGLCPIDESTPTEPRTSIFTATADTGIEVFDSPILDDDVACVELEIDSYGEATRLYRGGPEGKPQGRFAVVSIGQDLGNGEICFFEPQNQYYEGGYYPVPKTITTNGIVRISVNPGTTFTLYDTGLRHG